MFKKLISRVLNKLKPMDKPGNATLKKMNYKATIIVRRKDGSLKSQREIDNGNEILKKDY